MYYQIMDICRDHSNWVEDELDGTLYPHLQNKPWTELQPIRMNLLAHEQYIAACRLATNEFPWRDDKRKESLCTEIVELCKCMETADATSLRYRAITMYFFIASQLQGLGHGEIANQHVSTALDLLQPLPEPESPWA